VPSPTLASLVAGGCLDPELAALLWLLGEGGVPLVATGPAEAADRSAVARAILGVDPARAWQLLDADRDPPTIERLAGLHRDGLGIGVSCAAEDLAAVLSRLRQPPASLPEDAIRRLGVVVVVARTARGLRLPASHYLRPTERDAAGHVQRRPPAVLATWDEATDSYEHYAWGITPELADRVDRSQADLEDRRRERAGFLARMAADAMAGGHPGAPDAVTPDAVTTDWARAIHEYLEREPPRVPAPVHPRARPSPFEGGLTDPHVH
jgi:hypothetical protein